MTAKRIIASGLLLAASLAASPASAITVEQQAVRIIRGEINKCFEPPEGVETPYPPLEMLMKFNTFGALAGPPQVLTLLEDMATRKTAIAAIHAASRCVTLKTLSRLRRDYLLWKSIRLTVNIKPRTLRK